MLVVVVLFSHPVMSDSLWPHELQHARTHCSSPSPGICPSSCSLPWWCHPAFSSSEALFSFCPQSSPESGTFPMSCLFASDDQNTGASGSASVLLVNIQGWSPLRSTGLVSLLLGTLRSCLQHHSQKASILGHSAFFTVPLSQPYMATGKTIALTIQTFVSRAMSLLFNTLSRFVLAFLPRRNHLLISWLQSPSVVSLEPMKRKSENTSIISLLFITQ